MNASLHCDPSFQIFLLPPMYAIELSVALLGNLFALWLLVTRERRNWHPGVVFSCNLAISDVLYVLTLPLLILYYHKEKKWTFGNAACKTERFLFNCNLYVSMFFIMCISVNRYVAIVHPFFTRSYVLPKHAKMASALTWAVVVICSLPVLRFSGVKETGNQTLCVSNSEVKMEAAHYRYKLFLMLVGCLLPLVVTVASYLAVVWVVLRSRSITRLEKRKVALMVVLVCVLYAVSFVPYHLLQTYRVHLRTLRTENCWVNDAYQVSKGLAALNMCLHPLLYMAAFDSIRTVCCGRTDER